jgi:phosphohistidine phosphatase
MKTLLLLRHGKSSWDDSALADYERPLKPRGRRAARRMGQWLHNEHLLPDWVLCSTALRARETWLELSQPWSEPPYVEELPELYHCPVDGFAPLLHRVPDQATRVLVIGHNPGLADLLLRLCGVAEPFPTAALAHVECDLARWADFTVETPCVLRGIVRPRKLTES